MSASPAAASQRRFIIVCMVTQAAALLAVTVPAIVLHSKGLKPFARLFFCDDESIAYPYKPDTVTFQVALAGGVGVSIATILLVEAVRVAAGRDPAKGPLTSCLERCLSEVTAGYVSAVLRALYLATLGALCTELATQSGKLAFGRPRPHFLALCRLRNATACQPGRPYSIAESCAADVPEARMSFPSGHSSFSMYVAAFLALYLQARLDFRHPMHALKNVLQLGLLLLGAYVCMSRVSDYHHHWSDILAGGLLGAAVGGLVSLKFARGVTVYRPLRTVGESGDSDSDYELMRNESADRVVGETSPGIP